MSGSPPRYPPFENPHRLQMGLAALAADEPWIEIDAEFADDLAEKRRLLRKERAQVWVELPESQPAQHEALHTIMRHVARHYPGRAAQGDAPLPEDAPSLERAALLVQEDLCLMQERAGEWCLTAGAVCFPTRWDLPSKLGLPLTRIHERVPRYREDLAPSADAFFARMKSGRVFRRSNWSLLSDPRLFQPTGKYIRLPDRSVDKMNAGERVWIRMERQTVQRLPETGAVLFTIRVIRTPLAVLETDLPAARAMQRSLRSMSGDFHSYKSFPAIGDAVLGYLARIAPSA